MQSKHRKRVPRIRTITLHNRHHCYRFLHHRLFSSLPRRFIAISTRGRQWRDPRSLPETIRVFRSQINSLSRLWSHPRGAAGSQGDDDSRLDHGGGKSTMTTLRAHTRTVTPGGRNYTRNTLESIPPTPLNPGITALLRIVVSTNAYYCAPAWISVRGGCGASFR